MIKLISITISILIFKKKKRERFIYFKRKINFLSKKGNFYIIINFIGKSKLSVKKKKFF